MDLHQKEFEIIRNYIHRVCGIYVNDDKQYLILQRLKPVVLSQNCENFTEFAQLVLGNSSARLRDQIISSITTNETSFFRDHRPFETFRTSIISALCEKVIQRKNRTIDRKGSKVSILSAGSSTGQEPYSIAITIHEYLHLHPHTHVLPEDFVIVAADISSPALAKAIAGQYTDSEIQRGLNEMQKKMYFVNQNGTWIVKDTIKRLIEFRRVNFFEPFGYLGGFDIIFCRNMLIYFDEETKKKILRQFHAMIVNDGFLILGATENVYNSFDGFESVHINGCIVYRKK